jgi:hypothetical protein
MLANSSSDEEESDVEQTTCDRWEPAVPPSLKAGTEPPVTRSSTEVPAGTTEASVGAVEAPPEPLRKRKRGFSNLK